MLTRYYLWKSVQEAINNVSRTAVLGYERSLRVRHVTARGYRSANITALIYIQMSACHASKPQSN